MDNPTTKNHFNFFAPVADAGQSSFDLNAYTYDLPPELIAQEPASVRHESRLLHIKRDVNDISHKHFYDLPELLSPGDVLVVNDTSVIPARLMSTRHSGGEVEILLLRPEAKAVHLWQAMASPLRRLRIGEELIVESDDGNKHALIIRDIFLAQDGQKRILIDFGSQKNVHELISQSGLAPLPPYIQRKEITADKRSVDLNRYQTIFAKVSGAVAAPTAGLHFSQEMINKLNQQGVIICYITLHVGPGTFKPITDSVENHSIEPESFSISKETASTINQAKALKHRIIAVGTTSCRALETAWSNGEIKPVESKDTSLYIKPGFQFHVIDGLITNFHLSRSSLLVLVSTFAGNDLIRRAYSEAIKEHYRFYSYGDAMLIL